MASCEQLGSEEATDLLLACSDEHKELLLPACAAPSPARSAENDTARFTAVMPQQFFGKSVQTLTVAARKFATRGPTRSTPLNFLCKKTSRAKPPHTATAGTPETDAHNPPDNAHAPLTANAHKRRSPAALSPHSRAAQAESGPSAWPRSQLPPPSAHDPAPIP